MTVPLYSWQVFQWVQGISGGRYHTPILTYKTSTVGNTQRTTKCHLPSVTHKINRTDYIGNPDHRNDSPRDVGLTRSLLFSIFISRKANSHAFRLVRNLRYFTLQFQLRCTVRTFNSSHATSLGTLLCSRMNLMLL
jgi:hypothetical protein